MSGWIGVDLDGTLAEYAGWQGPEHIGRPIPAMVERVRKWLADGKEVRIFTARAWAPRRPHPDVLELETQDLPRQLADERRRKEAEAAMKAIHSWCLQHIGVVLPVTCEKDCGMVELWDDRAVQVVPNTGRRADGVAE